MSYDGLKPDAVVLVATVRALKYNGGVAKADLGEENLEALEKGIVNLEKHIENLQLYGVPVVVTLNRFVSDTDAELAFVREFCEKRGCDFASQMYGRKAAKVVLSLQMPCSTHLRQRKATSRYYMKIISLSRRRLRQSRKKIYGADGVTYSAEADRAIAKIEEMGFANMPVCMAKNQYSLSDDAKKLGRPTGFTVNIREVYVSAGGWICRSNHRCDHDDAGTS